MFILRQNSEEGFTLIEILIALALLSFILLMTPPIWRSLDYQSQTERFSVYQFFHIATDEIQTNQSVEATSNQLIIDTTSVDQIIITQYGNIIRRQINRTGQEVLLRDVHTFQVMRDQSYLVLKITMKSGSYYEKIITVFD